MKEIDFIPEWYKANQSRRKSYHRQYILLAVLLTIMMVWSFVVGQNVNKVRADVESIQSIYEKGGLKVDEGLMLEQEIATLRHQVELVDAASPRTNISSIMAELSWLIRGHIVLSKLSLTNELIQTQQTSASSPSGMVRMGRGASTKDSGLSIKPACMRITLTGIAEKGSDAAILISRLEESTYFEHVTPVYTKSVKVKDCNVTEFEICCYLADYTIEP